MTVDEYAEVCGLTTDEFVLLSSCVEAESNRSTDGDLSGRILICATILNRVNDDRFPDTITEVLTQRGQFTTIWRNGTCVTQRTEYSDEAVLQAIEMVENDEVPDDILYFNCRGYASEPYDYVGGNYFSLG